jgi:hypothetical protein
MAKKKQVPAKADPGVLDAVKRTVQVTPPVEATAPIDSLVLYFASMADVVPQWGSEVARRDKMLRQLFIKEPMVAGAVFSIVAGNAAFRWEVQSESEDLVALVTGMLRMAQFGSGWTDFVSRITIDLLMQDNGAFIEVVRAEDKPDSPVLGIAALESYRCQRTGNPTKPVIYTDEKSKRHKLNWWNVIPIVEMPSSIKTMRGMQYSAMSRVLTAAQIMRDIMIYRGEKVGGRFQRVLHIVGGPAKQDIKRALNMDQEDADNRGQARFMLPTILASLDPSKPVSHVEIPLASLPDNFDLEQEMKWYITTMAMAFGRDYQDFAPLPGGNLGTSHQSEILHEKSKGKGPSLFMEIMTYAMNYRGIVPYPAAKFQFKELDLADAFNAQKTKRLKAETRASMIKSGEITPEAARLMAIEEGDYDKKYLAEIERSEEEGRQRNIEEHDRVMALANAKRAAAGRARGAEEVKKVLRDLRPF